MQTRFEHGGITWIDMESPTRDEVLRVAAEFDIEPHIAEELLLPASKPRAEFRRNYVYAVLHFPALRHSHKTREQEVDFIVGSNYVVTTRYDMVDPLHKFSKVFEVNAVLDKSTLGDHAGYLFFYMLKKLYRAVDHELEYVSHDLRLVEEHVFSDQEVAMVAAISRSARDLLNLRQTIEPHREVLRDLEENGVAFWGEGFRSHLRTLSNEYYRVHNHVMRNTEFLHELRETNNSLLTTKQNETMRVLAIMSLFTFPLALLVAILGVDVSGNPVRIVNDGFWIITGFVALGGVIMFIVFKVKKWL